MTKFVVNTASDIVDPNDGKTSLREAIAGAGGSGITEISFDRSVFDGSSATSTLKITKALEIASGASIRIDGHTGSLTNNITLDATGTGTRIMTIAAGATVNLHDLGLKGGKEVGRNGFPKDVGEMGAYGKDGAVDGNPAVAETGGDGGDGKMGEAAEDGGVAAGGIFNAGALVLERVKFSNFSATGGLADGGAGGGDGGAGGNGGRTEISEDTRSSVNGNGGDGGNGADGGVGGDGGNAAGAILNIGSLLARDIEFFGNSAKGGKGGAGGFGGQGGDAGQNPRGGTVGTIQGVNGDAGDGGDGGNGGNGGSAASALLNLGTARFEGTIAQVQASTNTAGLGGDGGPGGDPGDVPFQATYGGADGEPGKDGLAGATGQAGAILGATADIANNTFIILADKYQMTDTGDAAARTITFGIRRLGDNAGDVKVNLSFTGDEGIDDADFQGGLPHSGTLDFQPYTSFQSFSFTLNKDGMDESSETFGLSLSIASGSAVVGWTAAATVVILGELAPPIKGTPGDDPNLKGTAGDDVMYGLGGNDKIFGLGGKDQMTGGVGNDTLDGGAGADTMAGRGGNDVYIVDNAGDKVIELADGGADTVRTSVTYALGASAYVETLQTTSLTGTGAVDLTGNAFGQSIIGNDGINIIDGKGGADTMTGRGGNDIYFVDNAGDKVGELADGGTDTVRTSVSYTLGASSYVETLQTTQQSGIGAIDLTGNALGQGIVGNDGVNRISGLGGDDKIFGLKGNDTLTGGTGKDIFFFTTQLSSANNVDTITDFNVADDTIRLEDAIFSRLSVGALSPDAFWKSAAGTAHDLTDRVIYDTDSGALYYDKDGNTPGGAGAIKFAIVGIDLALTNADFVVS